MTDTGFDKLIIPYNGDVPSGDTSEAKFRAGYSSPVTNVLTLGGVPTSNYIPLGFNDDSTNPNFDTNNNFNLSTGEYTQPNNCKNQINVKYTWKIVSSAATDMHLEGVNRIRINMANFAYVNSENIAITDANFFVNEIDATTVIGSTPVVLFTGTSEFSYTGDFLIGDILEERVFTNFQIFTPGSSFNLMWLYDGTFTNVPTNEYPDFYLVLGIDNNTDNNFIYSNPSSELKENSLIRINSFIPTQVKQKDFISSIIKMFNLYITNDEDDETNLIIQTRDEFYDSGKTLDWTKKIDMLSEQKLQFLPDVTNKRLLFSYKEDKDSYNTTYLQATGEIFGQQLYTFENEFVQDVKKVEPIFSPTPLLTNVFNNVVPAIDFQAPKNNIRILYYDGWIDGNWDFASGTTLVYLGINNVPPVEFQDFIIPFTKYPYAGHFDNPYTPSIDIDYGTNDYELYNNWSYISNNNLYNKYYKRQVSQIETGKLLTAKFNLNEYDIVNLDFRDKIWIHDSFWFVNKIQDYNANVDGSLTTVELINVDEGITFTPQQIEVENVGGKYSYLNNKLSLDTIIIDNTIGIGVSGTDILGGQGNVITDSTVRLRLAGNSNIAGVISGDIFGDINNLSGNDIFVNGSNNYVANGSNVNIQGNSNTLSASSENINIVGSGNTLGIYDTNIGIYNSSNNNIGNFVSGATLINSNNVTIASGVTNVVVINGNNLVITGSNQTYTSSGSTANVFELGTGLFSIRAINDSLLDAIGDYSYAEGYGSLATGFTSHAEGGFTLAGGLYSHAEGSSTFALGDYSHAEGITTQATGESSHAEGNQSKATGFYSHAEGYDTLSSNNASHAEGFQTIASAQGSHAEGEATLASGSASHAEGTATQATGDFSHSEGVGTLASAEASHAGGNGATSSNYGEWSRSSVGSGGQYGKVSWYGTTGNATATRLYLDQTAENFVFPVNTAYYVKIMIVLIDQATNDSKQFSGEGLVKNSGGTMSIVGTFTIASTNGDISLATTSVTMQVDSATDSLYPEVTGVLLTTINWFVQADYVRVRA
jgi:hypothetical protein